MVKDKEFYRTLTRLTIPLVFQNLIGFGLGFMDNLMVGSLGDLALSGVFLANQVQNILHMLTIGFGAAMVVLAAQYVGKGDVRQAKMVVGIGLKMALGIGLFCTVLVLVLPTQILGLFTDEAAVIAEGLRYIRPVSLSYAFFCVNSVLVASMRCVNNSRCGLYTSIIGFAANVFLNWVFIFGHLGFAPMGVAGAALGTMLSRILECVLSALYVRFVDDKLLIRIRDLLHTDLLLLRDFFRHGLPVILGDVFWGFGGAAQVAILGRLGAEVVAANTIAGNLGQLFGVVVSSVGSATGVIIGRTVGAGEYDKVKEYSRTLPVIFLSIGVVSGLLTFWSKDWILAAAFPEISQQAHTYSLQFLTVLAVTIVGTSYQVPVLTGIVRAGGATSFVLINDLIFVWLVVIPSAMIAAFVFHAPPVVVYACLKSDQILKCAVAVVKVNRFDWMRDLTRQAAPKASGG